MMLKQPVHSFRVTHFYRSDMAASLNFYNLCFFAARLFANLLKILAASFFIVLLVYLFQWLILFDFHIFKNRVFLFENVLMIVSGNIIIVRVFRVIKIIILIQVFIFHCKNKGAASFNSVTD